MADSHAMGAMQSEVYEAFRDRGAAEDEALRAAAVPAQRDDGLARAVTDIASDIAGVEGERIVQRWMLGFGLATNVAVVFELFSH